MGKNSFIALIIISALLILITKQLTNYSSLILIAFAIIILFNIKALMETSLNKYITYGFIVQTGYVLLDASISGLAGKSPFLGFVQLMNFVIAGLLLIISVRGNDFKKIKTNNYTLAGILISALALAGVPGLNLFIGEYTLYILAYGIHPLILSACFIASLLTLLTYLKLISYATASNTRERASTLLKTSIIILCTACITLGIIPWIQQGLIEVLM